VEVSFVINKLLIINYLFRYCIIASSLLVILWYLIRQWFSVCSLANCESEVSLPYIWDLHIPCVQRSEVCWLTAQRLGASSSFQPLAHVWSGARATRSQPFGWRRVARSNQQFIISWMYPFIQLFLPLMLRQWTTYQWVHEIQETSSLVVVAGSMVSSILAIGYTLIITESHYVNSQLSMTGPRGADRRSATSGPA
jgi:hypothetical protein